MAREREAFVCVRRDVVSRHEWLDLETLATSPGVAHGLGLARSGSGSFGRICPVAQVVPVVVMESAALTELRARVGLVDSVSLEDVERLACVAADVLRAWEDGAGTVQHVDLVV